MTVDTVKKKRARKPEPVIKIEKRDVGLFCRVKKSTKEYFDEQFKRSGAFSMGEFMDALAEKLRKDAANV